MTDSKVRQYKKLRIEAFDLIEKLVSSNAILTSSLEHNEKLQRKCLASTINQNTIIQNMVARIKHQDELIMDLSDDAIDQSKKEIN